MRIHRYARLATADLRSLIIGVALTVAVAGCGGSSSASPGSAPQSETHSTAPQRRVALATPQRAVQSYFEGIHAANGTILCNALDEGVQQALIKKIVSARPTEAGASCAQALTGLAVAITSPTERDTKPPPLHVKRTGDTAVVSYIGPLTHKPRTFTLVKHGSGWLIDKINGKG